MGKWKRREWCWIFYGNALIVWSSSLQSCIATSFTEAEYVALSDAVKQIMRLITLLNELGINQESTRIFKDINFVFGWVKDQSGKTFSKMCHIHMRFHYVKKNSLIRRKSPSWRHLLLKIKTRIFSLIYCLRVPNKSQNLCRSSAGRQRGGMLN